MIIRSRIAPLCEYFLLPWRWQCINVSWHVVVELVANGKIRCSSQGVPFRTSHDIVGRSVAFCVSKTCRLEDLSLDELRSISPTFEQDVYEYLGVEKAIKNFSSYGSTGSECVSNQLDYWIDKLELGKKREGSN